MRAYLTSAVSLFALFACTRAERPATADTTIADTAAPSAMPTAEHAMVTLRDAAGRELGTLTLTDTTGGIVVSGRLVGLSPGDHGTHIHAIGRCEPPAFATAGSHWNPTNRQHGSQNPEGPHMGDLPNVTAGADSTATVQGAVMAGGALRSGPNMLLDSDAAAIVIHAGPDDYRTNPSGGSGSPVACGVIAGM